MINGVISIQNISRTTEIEQEIRNFINLIIHCTECKKLEKSRNKALQGYGFEDAKFFYIGLAPGRLGADSTGILFTRDSSDELFQLALSSSGFISSDINELEQ